MFIGTLRETRYEKIKQHPVISYTYSNAYAESYQYIININRYLMNTIFTMLESK